MHNIGWDCAEILPLLVWAYHEWRVHLYVRRAYKALFFPEISSQNGDILYKLCCLREMALRLSRFSSPVFRVFARNARNFWCENYAFGDQIRRRTACIFRLELSNGSSSQKLILSVLCFRFVFVDFFQLIFWTTCQIRKKGKRRKIFVMFLLAEILIWECSWTITWQLIFCLTHTSTTNISLQQIKWTRNKTRLS